MTGLFVTAMVFLILVLLLQVRFRVMAELGQETAVLRVGLGVFWFTLYPPRPSKPRKPRKKKIKTKKQKESKASKEPKEALGMSLALFQEILDLALEILQGFRRRLQVDHLVLRLDWGLDDPADAAMSYGYANAVLGGLLALLEVNFKVKQKDVELRLDYTLDKPQVYCKLSCSLRLQQMLSLGLKSLVQGYFSYRNLKRQQGKEKAKQQVKERIS